jgi:transposase
MTRKRKLGRPRTPLLTDPKVREKVLNGIALGMTRERAAEFAGIARSTFYKIQAEMPELVEQVQQAEARCQARCLGSINKAAVEMNQWTAAAWLLERRWPEEFGRIDRHLIRSEGTGVPLPLEYVQAITNALGMTGVLRPLKESDATATALLSAGNGNGSGTIDVEVLPE